MHLQACSFLLQGCPRSAASIVGLEEERNENGGGFLKLYVKMKLRTGEEEEAAAIFNEQKKGPTDAYYGNPRDIYIYIYIYINIYRNKGE